MPPVGAFVAQAESRAGRLQWLTVQELNGVGTTVTVREGTGAGTVMWQANIRGGTTQHFTFDLSPGPSGVAFWAGMHIGGTNPAALSWEYHRT